MVFGWIFRRLLFYRLLTLCRMWGFYLFLLLWARKGLYLGLLAGVLMTALTFAYAVGIYWVTDWVYGQSEGYLLAEMSCWLLWFPLVWMAALDTQLYMVCLRTPNQKVLGNLFSTWAYEEKFLAHLDMVREKAGL
ncbi:hypothetical protein ACMG4P_03945 [Pseudovibrio denitrificans]|uniref:hypothetical protein n=1 Tax=Pseudovibrio denitrificans TaxID=258256 RepID=UPI0039BF917E